MKRVLLVLALAGCSHGSHPSAPDMTMPYPRTLTTRPLMATSPTNLLRDPFLTGGTSFGQFRAYYEDGASITLSRTLQSISPVGGAVSIGVLRDLPPANGATAARVTASFLGGAGLFSASVWISAGDVNATPIPFSQAASSLDVSLLGNDGLSKVALAPVGAAVTYGGREWVQYKTAGGVALPSGGWLSIAVEDLSLTLQIAAPEVTASTITGDWARGQASAMNDRDRRAVRQATSLDTQHSAVR